MPDEPRESQIVITYYPREGALERYCTENLNANDPTPGLETVLRTEALAAWESVGLIEPPGDDALERTIR